MAVEELSPEAVELMAREIHERYRKNQAGRKPAGDPSLAAWDDLPEPLRRSNRAQARGILDKLEAIGCTVHTTSGGKAKPIAFSEREIELMAVLEHQRWTAERLADDWKPGERNVLARRTPYLVSWAELPEEARMWDREAVRLIPELVAGAGLEIRRGHA
jgi:hypothetical protein